MGNQGLVCCDCLAGNRVGKPRSGSELHGPVTLMSKSAGLEAETEETTQIQGFHRPTVFTALARAEEAFLDMLAQDPASDPTYSRLLDKDGVQVFSKDTVGGYAIRSQWRTTTSPGELLSFINNPEARKSWDTHVGGMDQVATFDTNTRVLHIEYKKQFPVSARDLLIVCKTTCSGQDWLDVSCSVASEQHPPGKDVVRAVLVIGGYSFQRKGEEWEVRSVTELQFGGSVPKALVKQMSAASVPNFVQTLHKVVLHRRTQSAIV